MFVEALAVQPKPTVAANNKNRHPRHSQQPTPSCQAQQLAAGGLLRTDIITQPQATLMPLHSGANQCSSPPPQGVITSLLPHAAQQRHTHRGTNAPNLLVIGALGCVLLIKVCVSRLPQTRQRIKHSRCSNPTISNTK